MKPLEVIGIVVGVFGLGVGGFALFQQLRRPPVPPAADPGQPATLQVRATAPGTPAAGSPPVVKSGGPDVGAVVRDVGQTVGSIVNTVGQLGQLFSSFNVGF